MFKKIYTSVRTTLDKWLLEDNIRNSSFAYITDAQFLVLEKSIREIASLKKMEIDRKDYEIKMKDMELKLVARNNELLKKNHSLKSEMISLLDRLDNYDDIKLLIT